MGASSGDAFRDLYGSVLRDLGFRVFRREADSPSSSHAGVLPLAKEYPP
jgi:hypothetical protein